MGFLFREKMENNFFHKAWEISVFNQIFNIFQVLDSF